METQILLVMVEISRRVNLVTLEAKQAIALVTEVESLITVGTSMVQMVVPIKIVSGLTSANIVMNLLTV